MKMSILIGVTHMDFGIINNLYNNIFFRCAGGRYAHGVQVHDVTVQCQRAIADGC